MIKRLHVLQHLCWTNFQYLTFEWNFKQMSVWTGLQNENSWGYKGPEGWNRKESCKNRTMSNLSTATKLRLSSIHLRLWVRGTILGSLFSNEHPPTRTLRLLQVWRRLIARSSNVAIAKGARGMLVAWLARSSRLFPGDKWWANKRKDARQMGQPRGRLWPCWISLRRVKKTNPQRWMTETTA